MSKPSPCPENRDQYTSDDAPFVALVGNDVLDIIGKAPQNVTARVHKALDHYAKAQALKNIDDEMGVIRCIAGEEELVVAIFEAIKRRWKYMPKHKDFTKCFKNHRAKLAFYPVLSQMRLVFQPMFEQGVSLDGLGDVPRSLSLVADGGRVQFRFLSEDGSVLYQGNPLRIAVSHIDPSDETVVNSLYGDFAKMVQKQKGKSVREFVIARAGYRNSLLYATDGGFLSMAETLEELFASVFDDVYRDLLWCLAILLSNDPVSKTSGAVSQLFDLYRYVLQRARVLKPKGD